MQKRSIYVLGSINIDLVVYAERFPENGETIFGKEFFINQGGKGANQAVASKKSGGNATFIGRVGTDIFANMAINSLKDFGVGHFVTKDENSQTGIALINVDNSGENRITIIEGANGKVGEDELNFLTSHLKKMTYCYFKAKSISTKTSRQLKLQKKLGRM